MSEHRHLSDDALLDYLYGLAEHQTKLEACPVCRTRYRSFESKRAECAEGFEVSTEFLAAQRRRIYERIEQRDRKHLRWAPVFAAACLFVAGVFVYHPQHRALLHSNADDAQLFSEAYSMELTAEPSAAAPIQALFEEGN